MAGDIAHFFRFLAVDGTPIPGRAYQGFWPQQTRLLDGVFYEWAPFVWGDVELNQGGDMGEAQITTISNALTTAILSEAERLEYLVEVAVVAVVIAPPAPTSYLAEDRAECQEFQQTGAALPQMVEGPILSRSRWAAGEFEVVEQKPDSKAPTTCSLTLRSPWDAVTAQFPGRVLSSRYVGRLPATGQIVGS